MILVSELCFKIKLRGVIMVGWGGGWLIGNGCGGGLK